MPDSTVSPARPSPAPNSRRNYPAIDGLRTFGVVAVIGYHGLKRVAPGGFFGVDVFYAISGFVITLTLLREYERTGSVRLGAFYLRRFWRLTPALVLMLAFGAVIDGGAKVVSVGGYAEEAAKAITYTYNLWQAGEGNRGGEVLSHAWSLGVEEQFYIVWAPLLAMGLALAATRRRRVGFASALILAFAISRSATAHLLGTLPAFFLPWCRMDQMVVGGTLAFALHGHPQRWLARVARNRIVPILAAAALGVLMYRAHDPFSARLADGGYLGATVLAGVLIAHGYVDHVSRSPVRAVLSWAPIVWLGRRSYGIYLFHYPIVVAMRDHGFSGTSTFIVSAVGSVAVAAPSFRYVEEPLRKYGHARLQRRSAR